MHPSSPLIAKMTDLATQWETRRDNRAIFLRCYTLMTAKMLQALEDRRFEDNDWVERLLHRFADYYFEALACFDCGDPVPPVWRQVHEKASHAGLNVMQHLLLGVNAHINYDLVLTLYELLHPEWEELSPANRQLRYRDHRLVNQIIAETIDTVQDEVVETYAPYMQVVDTLMGRLDEHLLGRLITRWREEVWENAQLLLRCQEDHLREECIRQVETDVEGYARWVCLELPLIRS